MTDLSATFEVFGVVHLVRPLGRTANDLAALRAGIATVEPASLFLHAVQPPLRAPASRELPPDDFSAWVGGVLQDPESAERLTFAIQRSAPGPNALRSSLLEELDGIPARPNAEAPHGSEFAFLAADSVRVSIAVAAGVDELFEALACADASVWFYHLIEQPWFTGGGVPLARELRTAGEPRLARRLGILARSGLGLDAMRADAVRYWRRGRLGGRIARATTIPEAERAQAGRDAVARLARRLVRGDEDS